MSILDGQAVPTRVVGVLRALHRIGEKGCTPEELMAVMLPEVVRNRTDSGKLTDNQMVPDSLKVAAALGLAQPGPRKNSYQLSKAGLALGDPAVKGYPDRCAAELSRRLVGTQDDNAGNQFLFLRWALAWYLDLLPDEVPIDNDAFYKAIDDIRPSFGQKASDVAYGQILLWGKAVGLLVTLKLKGPTSETKSVTSVDPTPFLRRHLGDFMKPGQEVEVKVWVEQLANLFPVFDLGAVRTTVQSARKKPAQNGYFSPSLELALRRLKDEGILNWRSEADSPSYFLSLLGDSKEISHLTYRPEGCP